MLNLRNGESLRSLSKLFFDLINILKPFGIFALI